MNQSGKLLLFIILFSSPFISSAQKHKKHPIDVRVEIGVNHSFFHKHYPASDYSFSTMYHNIPISFEKNSYASFQGGIYFERIVNKRFTASARLLYTSRRTESLYDKVQLQNYYDTSGISQNYYYSEFSGMVQIPVSMAYRHNRWRMDVGMSVPFFYHRVSNSESFTEKNRGSKSSFIWNEGLDFQLIALVKLEYELNTERKINMFASATHTFFSDNLEKTIYAVGVNVSLSKLFFK